MKKFFIAVSVLMALTFFAGPSNALIGVEDPVQGNAFRVPFIVGMVGGVDTAVIYQETSTNAALFGTGLAATPQRGILSWIIWSPQSVHVGDGTRVFTRGDVDAMSLRDMITNFVGAGGQAALEIDLDGDGVNDHYAGYMTATEVSTLVGNPGINNLLAYVQFIDLANGQAAGTLATMYELANVVGGFTGGGYLIDQVSVSSAGGFPNAVNFDDSAINGVTGGTWEVMSPNAYVVSYWRERAMAILPPTFIRFTPRWYLHDATGESYVMIYKSVNHAPAVVNVRFWDNNEFSLSGAIDLPNEMNIINMRLELPAAFFAAYPAAGWIDIRNPDILGAQLRWPATAANPLVRGLPNWAPIEWTCWVWNVASSPAAGLNWSALWVDKEVGTM
ncbi:MAG: hypothetical protein K9N21_07935 [Deltaproteobacteria bacterium]|nr:hypothetical protein [Deltaproteobacteria bacterium]